LVKKSSPRQVGDLLSKRRTTHTKKSPEFNLEIFMHMILLPYGELPPDGSGLLLVVKG